MVVVPVWRWRAAIADHSNPMTRMTIDIGASQDTLFPDHG